MISTHTRNVHGMHSALRCQAMSRSGAPCRAPAVRGKRRCHVHGGLGSKEKSKSSQKRDYAKASSERDRRINAEITTIDRLIRKLARGDEIPDLVSQLTQVRRGLRKTTQRTNADLAASYAPSPAEREAERNNATRRNYRRLYCPGVYRAPEMIRDRAVGAMLGLAVGDALGVTLDGQARDSYRHIDDMLGGGTLGLRRGEWTGNTAMALALMESLTFRRCLDETDLMDRFLEWREEGAYSCTGTSTGIGETMLGALARYKLIGDSVAGTPNPDCADNGSLVRIAPVAVGYWNHSDALLEVAERQSCTTHAAAEAVDACVALAEIIAAAIEGKARHDVLRGGPLSCGGAIGLVREGTWRGKSRDRISSGNYAAHTLEAALWCVDGTSTFEEAVIRAANLGENACATAAVAGQLAGALYGASAIPGAWRDCLEWSDRIAEMAGDLFQLGRSSSGLAARGRF